MTTPGLCPELADTDPIYENMLNVMPQVRENGMEDGVMTIEEIRFGDDTRGTGEIHSRLMRPSCTLSWISLVLILSAGAELANIDRTVLVRALRTLEQRGKATLFRGTSTDDEGVKFSA